MATIKAKFRPSSVSTLEGGIYYQIIHERRVRRVITDYHIYSTEWDELHECIALRALSSRRMLMESYHESMIIDRARFGRIIRELDSEGLPYSADDIVERFRRLDVECSLRRFMCGLIMKMRMSGRIRTSEAYKSALNSFMTFLSSTPLRSMRGNDISLDAISAEVMEDYQMYLTARGVTTNTVSFYMRILRAVYNRAVDRGLIQQKHPFRRVYTGIDKTVKRALPIRLVKKIKSLDLSRNPSLDYARDMFLMSFFLRGMSFVDMAFLKSEDLHGGYVSYRRRKTGQLLTIAWTMEMQQILDKYPPTTTGYLLPIIRVSGVNERYAYLNAAYNINRALKKIAGMVGVTVPLTLYVARHSWASAARAKGIPLSVISEGMGHESEATTQIYLASLDSHVVDRANSLLIKALS